MHYRNANKTPGEKANWELHKNATCCFEQILEATAHKTTFGRPLPSHQTNNSSKTNETSWVLMEKYKWTHKRRLLMNSNTWKHQCWITYIYQLWVDTIYCREDLPRIIDDRNGWRESGNTMRSAQLCDGDDDDVCVCVWVGVCVWPRLCMCLILTREVISLLTVLKTRTQRVDGSSCK